MDHGYMDRTNTAWSHLSFVLLHWCKSRKPRVASWRGYKPSHTRQLRTTLCPCFRCSSSLLGLPHMQHGGHVQHVAGMRHRTWT